MGKKLPSVRLLHSDLKAKLGLLVLLNKLLTLPKGGDALMPLSESRCCSLDAHIGFNIETPRTTKPGAAQTPDCWQVALKVLELTLRNASCSIETAPSGWLH